MTLRMRKMRAEHREWLGWGLRLVPIGYTVLYLGLLNPSPKVGWDWGLGLASAALVLGGGRWPLAMLLGQACALTAGAMLAPVAINFLGYFAAIALVELAFRASALRVWIGGSVAGVLGAVFVALHFNPVGTGLIAVISTVGPLLLGGYLRAQRELARHTAARAAEAERLRVTEARAARASERTAVARELHDLLAHHVASMVLRAGVARHVVTDADPALSAALDDVHATGVAVLADLRRLVGVLRDTADLDRAVLIEPGDLMTELEAAAGRTRGAGRQVQFDVDRGVAELDAVRRAVVLRIVQESLTNVLKHAGTPVSVVVRIVVTASGVDLEISDDGSAGPPGSGHGLIGMRERVELIGGTFDAGPTERGWRVAAALPSAARSTVHT